MIRLIVDPLKEHENIKLEMEGLCPSLLGDTYWYNNYIKMNLEKPISAKEYLANEFDKFITAVLKAEINSKVMFPYDIGDQHLGFIVAKKLNNRFANFYVLHTSEYCAGDIQAKFQFDYGIEITNEVIFGGTLIKLEELLKRN